MENEIVTLWFVCVVIPIELRVLAFKPSKMQECIIVSTW